MQFGKIDNPDKVDFTLPVDQFNYEVFSTKTPLRIDVGCSQWSKTELKSFYPKGVKDPLRYYAQHFNCVEMNATFYRMFPYEQFEKWRAKTPSHFRFYVKLSREISHYKKLYNTERLVDRFIDSVLVLEEQLGSCFLQMPETFTANNFKSIEDFIAYWPSEIPLSIELRHSSWYEDEIFDELKDIFHQNQVCLILTDTAGRRDLVHMSATSSSMFIRFVGANHPTDYTRLDDWVSRLKLWVDNGLKNVSFFIHQNIEEETPLLASHLITKLNKELGINLNVPITNFQTSLF